MPSAKNQFEPARVKLSIASIDVPSLRVDAQYNPKELAIDKTINWSDPPALSKDQASDKSTQNDLNFNGASMRTMTIELFFDGFETGQSVQEDVGKLEQLSSVWNPNAEVEHERRPHHCLVGLGAGNDAMRPFLCVIESLNTKYTMWDTNGKLLRATCTVGLKEANRLEKGSKPNLNYGVKQRDRF